MIDNWNEATAHKAAAALGWSIDDDGFLIHTLSNHGFAQELFNREYAKIAAEELKASSERN